MRAVAVALALLAPGAPAQEGAETPDFGREILPLLREHCVSCHGPSKKKGRLRLDLRAEALRGGIGGKAIVPGRAKDSPLYALLLDSDPEARMPQDAPPLPAAKIELLRRWIDAGAFWPDAHAGEEAAAPPHWSHVRPVAKDPPPGAAHPVDAFLGAERARRGLAARPEAPRPVLLRRLHLDLLGVPPTPQELAAFAADPDPAAYEKAVDRLLADPRHGERWARHFMDIWRYSDWAGYQKEVRESQPNIWRWRDWIVESLNADLPYDRMVLAMLAGDEIAPEDPSTLRATGFLARNWSRYNREGWLQAAVEHSSKAFLATTMNCARCHDHFFDPILQEEYYAFRAVFEPHHVRTDHLEGGAADPALDGLVRAFDAQPDAKTHLFERGDDRRPDTSRSIPPAAPKALGGGPLAAAPIALSEAAVAPERRPFVRALLLAAEEKAVADAARALAKADKDAAPAAALELSVAEARRAALAAVLEAELHAEKSEGWTKAAQAAVLAQRRLALLEASKARLAALKAGGKKLEDADKALAKAEAELAKPPSTSFTPRKAGSYPSTSTGRRLALARWIVSPENPVAARVLVNHVWLRHFGSALVPTVFDFGMNGAKPSHPELLDWLAVELMRGGWSLRKLHRLLVTSAAYRMESTSDAASAAKDPENRLLWRMNARRMEAEAVRDSVLAVAGTLDAARGGPDLDAAGALTGTRRSLYYRHAAEKQAEFLRLFDAANVAECYERSESIVPQQALALANSTLVQAAAATLAGKLSATSSADDAFTEAAYAAVLGRPPSAAEKAECLAFLAEAPKARAGMVHVLFNHNDFITIR